MNKKNKPEIELLTRKEAAKFLGKAYQTLAYWSFLDKLDGKIRLPFVRLGNDTIRYKKKDLIEFLDEQKRIKE